jgi:two-component system, chemotaxis family, protein-glutamate methylesterase/glutaminase
MTEGTIRVLIIDDSAYMRKVLRDMLDKNEQIVGEETARNGQEGLDRAAELDPDVIITDLLMPDIDGVAFIRQQMSRNPIPIVVCSSASAIGDQVIAALEAGAVDFVQKPTALALETMYNIQREIVQAVLNAAAIPTRKLISNELPLPVAPPREMIHPVFLYPQRIDALLIGVSTGGPRALRALLPRIPKDFPVGICIVLHIPVGYTEPLVNKLNELSEIEVLESHEGLEMKPGRAILARAGLHTRLYRTPSGQVATHVSPEPESSLYIPSTDELFKSGAQVYGSRVLGLIMTGMGSDGTAGAGWIKAQGGLVYAESEESSVIFGMPRSAIEAGLVDRIVSLNDIPNAVMEVLQ